MGGTTSCHRTAPGLSALVSHNVILLHQRYFDVADDNGLVRMSHCHSPNPADSIAKLSSLRAAAPPFPAATATANAPPPLGWGLRILAKSDIRGVKHPGGPPHPTHGGGGERD